MARQRWSSMSFCPRLFHEPRRRDFVLWSLPLLVVFETCWLGLPLVRVRASAGLANIASRQNRPAINASGRLETLLVTTAKSVPRTLLKEPKTNVASSIISRLDARRHSGVHLGNVTEVYRPGRWFRRSGRVPGVLGKRRLARSSGLPAPCGNRLRC